MSGSLQQGGGSLPERRLTNEQFELVIRRAAELQARAAERTEEGLSEQEVIRIGRELGLSGESLGRALAEVRGRPDGEEGWAERLFGDAVVSASRTVPGDADEVRSSLETYLIEREWLAPVRRFPDRTLYEKARGLDVARALTRAREALGGVRQPFVGAGFDLKTARSVEVAVQQLEPGFSHVRMTADLSNTRAGFATGTLVGGGGSAVAVATVLGIAVAPAAALLGLPVLGGIWFGLRAGQQHVASRAQLHLDAILDALERKEALVAGRRLKP
jgi:hypothetical protein